MRSKRLKTFSLAAASLAFAWGAPGEAAAYAYAYTYLDIFNISVTTSGPNVSLVNAQIAGDAAADSTTTACGPVAYGSGCDIPVARSGNLIPDNTFSPQEVAAMAFSRGDGNAPNASRMQGLAEAKSSLLEIWKGSWTYDVTAQVVVTGGGSADTATFAFDAIVDQLAKLTGGALPGSGAQSSVEVSFSLTDIATGVPVFVWAPDGILGGITGGTELNDPFSLQVSLARLGADGIAMVSRDSVAELLGPFSAVTLDLADGTYALTATASGVAAASFYRRPASEPASLALLGLGLAGFGAARRRREGAAEPR